MCNCKKREQYKVVLPGGIKITKSTEAAAKDYASKHPGAIVSKG